MDKTVYSRNILLILLILLPGFLPAQPGNFPEPRHPVQRPEPPTSVNPTIPTGPEQPGVMRPDLPYPDEQNPVFGGANIDSMRQHFTNELSKKSLPGETLSDTQLKKTKRDLEKVVRFVFRYIDKEDRVRRSGYAGSRVVISQQDSPLHYGLISLESWLEAQGCVESTQFSYIHGGAVVYNGAPRPNQPDDFASLRSGETAEPRDRSSEIQSLDASVLFVMTDSKPYRATLDISYRHDPYIELINVWVH